jgi:hypothetical protein
MALLWRTHSCVQRPHSWGRVFGGRNLKVGEAAEVCRLRLKPGFCGTPDGFSIDAYTLDQDKWTELLFVGARMTRNEPSTL